MCGLREVFNARTVVPEGAISLQDGHATTHVAPAAGARLNPPISPELAPHTIFTISTANDAVIHSVLCSACRNSTRALALYCLPRLVMFDPSIRQDVTLHSVETW